MSAPPVRAVSSGLSSGHGRGCHGVRLPHVILHRVSNIAYHPSTRPGCAGTRHGPWSPWPPPPAATRPSSGVAQAPPHPDPPPGPRHPRATRSAAPPYPASLVTRSCSDGRDHHRHGSTRRSTFTATSTACTYIVAGSITNPFGSKSVNLDYYEVFNKTVTLAAWRAAEEAEEEKVAKAPKGFDDFECHVLELLGGGMTAIYFTSPRPYTSRPPHRRDLAQGYDLAQGHELRLLGIATLNGKQSFSVSSITTRLPSPSWPPLSAWP